MSTSTPDKFTLLDRLYTAVTAMPTDHKTIEAAEQAIRDAFDDGDAIITGVYTDAEHDWRVNEARDHLRGALGNLNTAVREARRGYTMAKDAYDVEIVETGAERKILAALDQIDLLVDAIKANVPEPGQ